MVNYSTIKPITSMISSNNVPAAEQSQHDGDKEPETTALLGDTTSESESNGISPEAQAGVQGIEAMTSVWSKNHLIAAYIMIWVISFLNTIESASTSALTPYVTSSFKEHSLTATTSIMSSIIGGLVQLPLAKVLDIWGRPQGYALMTFFLTVGLVMMAVCNNVQTYAAAQVFYRVGYNGLNYVISIFVADTSALKNRSLMFAYVSSSYIITVWIGGPIANYFLRHGGFRWAFGMWAVLTPFICMPLWFLFMYNYRKAERLGLMPKQERGRTTMKSLKDYSIEFDLVGLILIAGGLALFLLPFSLYSYQSNGWQSPMIISMLVSGILLLISFTLYERFLAPKTFIPYSLLTDRTVLGAYILAAVLFIEFYIWDSYFNSFLQVVNNLSITEASYVVNIYSLGSCLFSIVVGLLIRWSGRFKWLALYFGVPVTILGVASMIKFRQPNTNVGWIIMCQILISFGGGTIVICEQIAAMAASSHQFVAVVLAVEGMFANVGAAIGSSVAAAIWTGTFRKKLEMYLPDEVKGELMSIYGDLAKQLSYEWGSETRDGIIRAYGESQRVMLLSSTGVLVLAIVAVAMWRDIKVKDFKQVKGMVV